MSDEPMKDENEFERSNDGVVDSIGRLFAPQRLKSAFDAASTPLKIAAGAFAVGILIKPALFVGGFAAFYGIWHGVETYLNWEDNKDDGPDDKPPPSAPKPDDLTF